MKKITVLSLTLLSIFLVGCAGNNNTYTSNYQQTENKKQENNNVDKQHENKYERIVLGCEETIQQRMEDFEGVSDKITIQWNSFYNDGQSHIQKGEVIYSKNGENFITYAECEADENGYISVSYDVPPKIDNLLLQLNQPEEKEKKINTTKTCNIKGNISYKKQEKIYHMPGCSHYNDTKINTDYGEKWFCSEQEARNAGWRKCKEY